MQHATEVARYCNASSRSASNYHDGTQHSSLCCHQKPCRGRNRQLAPESGVVQSTKKCFATPKPASAIYAGVVESASSANASSSSQWQSVGAHLIDGARSRCKNATRAMERSVAWARHRDQARLLQ